MTKTLTKLLSGIALIMLAGCKEPSPPQGKIEAFPGADAHVTIEPVACNVQIDHAQFERKRQGHPT